MYTELHVNWFLEVVFTILDLIDKQIPTNTYTWRWLSQIVLS